MVTEEQPGGMVTPPVVLVPVEAVVAVAAVVPLVAVAAVVPVVAVAAVVPVVAVATAPVVAVATAPVVGVLSPPQPARLVPRIPISATVLSHFFVLDAIVVSSLITNTVKETMAFVMPSSILRSYLSYSPGAYHPLSCVPATNEPVAILMFGCVARICSMRRVISCG